ncbi:response regulator transcription factor [Butyrivibrio fibrisolvens]|uniref:response regulator transcription factor n=1 Tax=Butyrivibrio fibrisolvens TaxID=831 RepID=UPI0004248B68|nr:response regulator [Butyrivibrio fibrisolvens]
MISVFLVEDEIVMREGIRSNINWSAEGYKFVGEAGDGELAYPMIRDLKPDIVITDIRMPFMDGLELSRLIKKELPSTRIIILSGYDDFQYAREAISIGVTDYLLKPISGAQLLEAIGKVSDGIKAEQDQLRFMERYKKEREENRILEKRVLFRQLVAGALSMPEILNKGKALGINLAAGAYGIVMFQIKVSDESRGEGQITESYSESIEKITSVIRDKYNSKEGIQVYEQLGGVFVFLVLGRDRQETADSMDGLLGDLEDMMSDKSGINYYAGTGCVVDRIREVGRSYESASKAFAHRFLYDSSRVFDGHRNTDQAAESAPINMDEIDIGKLDRRIVTSFLNNGSSEELLHFVEDFVDNTGKGNFQSLIFRQYISVDLYFTVVSFLESIGYSRDEITEKLGNIDDGQSSQVDTDKTKDYIHDILSKALEMRDKVCDSRYSSLINSARSYIYDHYSDEDISLNQVAASVNISPNHFSSVFKKETGETFIEFLTRVRMDKAKELLETTDLKAQEIGYKIGYRDPHYFSYIFKKTQNITPRQYRDKV